MIKLKTREEIEKMRVAGQVVAECHRRIARMIGPGVTTAEIDELVEDAMRELGARPAQKGYKGYRYATCASVNDVIAHGFPSREPLKEGDLVKIDMVAEVDGWMADSCWCYAIGQLSEEAERLMRVTRECLEIGIELSVPGNRIGDAMHALQRHAEANGFSVVRDLVGHGIGRAMHEPPQVPHYGRPNQGFRIQEGMVFTIEPMLNAGKPGMTIDDDGWTCRTIDGRLSAQFEHTIAITADGPVILTDQGQGDRTR